MKNFKAKILGETSSLLIYVKMLTSDFVIYKLRLVLLVILRYCFTSILEHFECYNKPNCVTTFLSKLTEIEGYTLPNSLFQYSKYFVTLFINKYLSTF